MSAPSGELMQAIGDSTARLESLNMTFYNPFYRGNTFTDDDFLYMIKNQGQLKHLYINNSLRKKSISTIESIPRYLNDIETLEMNNCDSLSVGFFTELLRHCPKVRRLSFWKCN